MLKDMSIYMQHLRHIWGGNSNISGMAVLWVRLAQHTFLMLGEGNAIRRWGRFVSGHNDFFVKPFWVAPRVNHYSLHLSSYVIHSFDINVMKYYMHHIWLYCHRCFITWWYILVACRFIVRGWYKKEVLHSFLKNCGYTFYNWFHAKKFKTK